MIHKCNCSIPFATHDLFLFFKMCKQMFLVRFFTVFLLALFFHSQGQPLRDINFRYQYNPDNAFDFSFQPFRQGDTWNVVFQLTPRKGNQIKDFAIKWEAKTSISENQGNVFRWDSAFASPPNYASNSFVLDTPGSIIVAQVIQQSTKKAWYFYKSLENTFNPFTYAIADDEPLLSGYVRSGKQVTLQHSAPVFTFFYKNEFPAASPPFAEKLGSVSKTIAVDSTFIFDRSTSLNQEGLYLFQEDTTSNMAVTLLVRDDYPRLTKLSNLAEALVYVCTKQEYERIKAAKDDKKTFDRIILNICGTQERAKLFIRNYFQRVGEANQLFSSYKEGWKTDRGMVYIILGQPAEVYKAKDKEIWKYDKSVFDGVVEFARAPSLFDAENYVLIRNDRMQRTWYEQVDLWRQGRI